MNASQESSQSQFQGNPCPPDQQHAQSFAQDTRAKHSTGYAAAISAKTEPSDEAAPQNNLLQEGPAHNIIMAGPSGYSFFQQVHQQVNQNNLTYHQSNDFLPEQIPPINNFSTEPGELSQDSFDFNHILAETQDNVQSMINPLKQEENSFQTSDDPTANQDLSLSNLGVTDFSLNEMDNWLEEFHNQRAEACHQVSLSQGENSTASYMESPMRKLCSEVLNESSNSTDKINLAPTFDGTLNTGKIVRSAQHNQQQSQQPQQPQQSHPQQQQPQQTPRPRPQINKTSQPTSSSKVATSTDARTKRPSTDVANAPTAKTPAKRRARSQSSPPAKSRSRKRMDNALNERWKSQMALREALMALEKAKAKVKECRSRYASAKAHVQTIAKDECDSLLNEETPWNEMFRQLKKYKEESGDCNVKQKFGGEDVKLSPDLVRLSAWVGKNRKDGKARGRGAGVIAPKPGVVSKQDKSSDENGDSESDDSPPLDKNNSFQNEDNDDSSVFEDIDPESIKAEPYKEIALDRIGFDWDPRNSRWNSMYEELKAYKEKNGTTLVPHANFGLGSWVKRQQVQYSMYSNGDGAKSELTEDRVRLLNELGFIWSRRTNTWNANFERLEKWKNTHGTCNIPDDPDDLEMSALNKWVTDQRVHYKRYLAEKEANENVSDQDAGKKSKRKLPSLTPEKIAKLQSIGFEFDARDAKWLQKLEVLKKYKERHGDFLVPSNYPEDPTLSNWVASQRAQFNLYKKGSKSHMTERRLKILQDIGFSFSVNEERQKVKEEAAQLDRVMFDAKPWEHKFKDLLFYIASHGGLESIQKNDPFLAEWTAEQKKECQQLDTLTDGEDGDENEINNELKHRVELMRAAEAFVSLRSSKEKAQPQVVKNIECSCPSKEEIFWERQYGALAAWYIKYGTYASKGMPSKMKKFMSKQQEQFRALNDGDESDLTTERVEKLEEIFFPFDKASSKEIPEDDVAASRRNRSWEEYRADLAISYIQKGNYDSQALDDLELRRWATEQKRQHKLYLAGKQSMLTYDQIQKLIDIKFISKRPRHLSWAENCAQLMAIRIQYGNFNLSNVDAIKPGPKKGKSPKHSVSAPVMKSLKEWMAKLRTNYNQSPESLVACQILTQDQVMKLNSVGFPWIESMEDATPSNNVDHQDRLELFAMQHPEVKSHAAL